MEKQALGLGWEGCDAAAKATQHTATAGQAVKRVHQ